MKFHSKFVSTVLAVYASLLLGACSGIDDDDNPPSAFEPSPVGGIWSAKAYGKIFEFNRSGNGYNLSGKNGFRRAFCLIRAGLEYRLSVH